MTVREALNTAMEEEMMTADALAPTGDAERDRRAKKRYVAHCFPLTSWGMLGLAFSALQLAVCFAFSLLIQLVVF